MPTKPPAAPAGTNNAGVLRRSYQIFIDRPPEAVFEFFASRKNHARICPDDFNEEVLGDPDAPLADKTQMTVQTRRASAASRTMTTEISDWKFPNGWTETQIVGPFASWTHRRKFAPFQTGTLLSETIEYVPLSGGPIGVLADKMWLGKRLDAYFNGRHKEAKRLLEQIGRIKGR